MDAKSINVGKLVTCGVSIHAPVMDAKLSDSDAVFMLGFNPRARDGRESMRDCA